MEENLRLIDKHLDENGRQLVERAYNFAAQAHGEQKRLSGEPYITHLLATAQILAEIKLDATTLASALLHDTLEDTDTTHPRLVKEFGEEIAFLVSSVSKISNIKYRGQEREVENFRRMFLAMAKDIRVILIKLADRLHNIRTIEWLPENKRKRIARETMEIYAPLAGRLGLFPIKSEFEDLCFPVIYPQEFEWLKKEIASRFQERLAYLECLKPIVIRELKKDGINFNDISFRAKHYWSLYRKLQRYEMDLEKIHDLVAARIIVPTVSECYATLGTIHRLWHPMSDRIKDFIATPRPNGYQSLHTTVFADGGAVVEFQIRTPEMHEIAEKGVAAHWFYDEFGKNHKSPAKFNFKKGNYNWILQLSAWQANLTGNKPREFLDSLKIDFFHDRIFVFTPKGDVVDLPEEATPIDFAYQIHSEIGDHCVGVKVNGKMTALSEPLKNSDVVEILTSKNKKPSSDWLTFVKTTEARRHIQKALGLPRGPSKNVQKGQKVQFRLSTSDRIGLLKDLSSVFSSMGVNIISSTTDDGKNKGKQIIIFNVALPSGSNISDLLRKLKKVKSVKECEKISLE